MKNYVNTHSCTPEQQQIVAQAKAAGIKPITRQAPNGYTHPAYILENGAYWGQDAKGHLKPFRPEATTVPNN